MLWSQIEFRLFDEFGLLLGVWLVVVVREEGGVEGIGGVRDEHFEL